MGPAAGALRGPWARQIEAASGATFRSPSISFRYVEGGPKADKSRLAKARACSLHSRANSSSLLFADSASLCDAHRARVWTKASRANVLPLPDKPVEPDPQNQRRHSPSSHGLLICTLQARPVAHHSRYQLRESNDRRRRGGHTSRTGSRLLPESNPVSAFPVPAPESWDPSRAPPHGGHPSLRCDLLGSARTDVHLGTCPFFPPHNASHSHRDAGRRPGPHRDAHGSGNFHRLNGRLG